MVTEHLPDWMQKALLVGTYNDLPLLVKLDSAGQFFGGLGAYHDRYGKTCSVVSTGSDINVDTDPVDAGEVWIITNINVYHNDPIPRQVTVFFKYSTIQFVLFRNLFLLENEVMDRQGEWILKEGNYIRATFVTPASGKTGWVNVVGYKVEVAS